MAHGVWKYVTEYTTFDGDVGLTIGALSGGSSPSSGAFPASNDAILVPIYLHSLTLVKRLFTANGGTASGNIDIGIYTQDGAKIVSSGSTAQSGTTAPQFFDITDFALSPGRYYLAVAMDNTTGTLFRSNLAVIKLQALGMVKQATAFPLPASITFASVTAQYLPLIGMEIGELK